MGTRGPVPKSARLKLLNGRAEGNDSAGRPVTVAPTFKRAARSRLGG